jgi:hypothetical protein
MKEIWKNIPNFNNYEASNLGRIRNKNGRILSTGKSLEKGGYKRVTLRKRYKGKQYSHAVHRLIILTFKGKCPVGKEVRHLDGNPLNNKIKNLVYGTRSENINDRWIHGEDVAETYATKLCRKDANDIRKLIKTKKYKQREIAKIYNVSDTTICAIKYGVIW